MEKLRNELWVKKSFLFSQLTVQILISGKYADTDKIMCNPVGEVKPGEMGVGIKSGK